VTIYARCERAVLELIVIPIAIEPDGAHHKDFPQVHSRTSISGVSVFRNHIFEDGKNFFSQILIAIDMLEPQKQLGNFIPGPHVKFDLVDRGLPECHLWFKNFTQNNLEVLFGC
jgi:hypothetical protein